MLRQRKAENMGFNHCSRLMRREVDRRTAQKPLLSESFQQRYGIFAEAQPHLTGCCSSRALRSAEIGRFSKGRWCLVKKVAPNESMTL